jgi:hypothetical protein
MTLGIWQDDISLTVGAVLISSLSRPIRQRDKGQEVPPDIADAVSDAERARVAKKKISD